MRSEDEMMKLILDIAMKDERIRLVTLEGSRTNKNVPRDRFQDYDISYFVTDMDSFTSDDSWLDQFGERMMMQNLKIWNFSSGTRRLVLLSNAI